MRQHHWVCDRPDNDFFRETGSNEKDNKPAAWLHETNGGRIDLILEYIRQHYIGASSPLHGLMARHAGLFDQFMDFRAYVDFFMLQDFVPDGFKGSPISTIIRE